MHPLTSCPSSCTSSTKDLLLSIIEQEIAIVVRIGQVFQAGTIPPNPDLVGLTSTEGLSVCSSSDSALYAAWLTQKQAIFNALFLPS